MENSEEKKNKINVANQMFTGMDLFERVEQLKWRYECSFHFLYNENIFIFSFLHPFSNLHHRQ